MSLASPTSSANTLLRETTSMNSWMAVSTVAMATFVLVTSELLPIGLLTPMAMDLEVTEGRAGLLVTVPGLLAAIAAPAVAVLAGRANRRTLLVSLTVLIALSDVAMALSTNLPVALAARVLLGVGVGAFWTFAPAVGPSLVTPKEGARATAIILAGISLGTVLGAPFGSFLGTIIGWRWAFGVVALFAFLAAAGQSLLIPSLIGTSAVRLTDLMAVLSDRQALLGFVTTALIAAGHFSAYTYLAPLLTHVGGFDQGELGLALAAYGITGLAGNLLARRAAVFSIKKTFAGVGLVIAFSIVLLSVAGYSAPGAAIGVALWGAAFGAFPGSAQYWTYRAVPCRLEAASAVLVTVFQAALAIGAAAGGILLGFAGLKAAFLAGAAACAFGALSISMSSKE